MDDWFSLIPYNREHLNAELIKTTFLSGGYYRANLPGSRVSILAMNTIGYSPKNVNKDQGDQQRIQLQWLEEQLASAESWRKFVITNHIYVGL